MDRCRYYSNHQDYSIFMHTNLKYSPCISFSILIQICNLQLKNYIHTHINHPLITPIDEAIMITEKQRMHQILHIIGQYQNYQNYDHAIYTSLSEMKIHSTINVLLMTITHFIFIMPVACNTCFYNKLFSLFGTGGTPAYPQASPYQVNLVWGSTQSPIINSSFYWRGFTMSSPAKLISFDASLGAVDSTSGTFFFNPTANSEVYYVQFGILILKSCTNAINIIFYQHNNCLLAPGTTTQTVSITLGTPFQNVTSNYITQAILSSFTTPYPDTGSTRLTLKVQCQAIGSGSNIQAIVLSTLQKTISKLAFTYILIHIPSLVPAVYYQSFNFPWIATNDLKVPKFFDARNTFDCIVGLKNLDTQYTSSVPSHSITFAISNSADPTIFVQTSSVEIIQFQYSRVCVGGNCPNGSHIDKTAFDFICNPCDHYMPGCTACSAYNLCNYCNQSYFLNSTTNASCVSCPVYCLNCTFNGSAGICSLCADNYYIDSASGQCFHCPIDCYTCNNNSTCLTCYYGRIVNGGCSNQSDCIQVTKNLSTINKCLNCSQNSSLVSGYCVNTIGCITASSTNNVSVCLFCDTSANFQNDTINNSCFCMANHVYSHSKNKSCTPCPSNCILCEQRNGLIICITCQFNFTLYQPKNLACLALQPNCISWEIISGVVSCLTCANNSYKSVATSSFDYIRSCIPCLIDCITCKSDRTCQTCLYDGWPVLGGCTRIPGCLEVKRNDLSTSKCLKCYSYDNYRLKIGLCVNITGCVVPRMVDNKIICLSCDVLLSFKPVPIDSVCLCRDGYSLNQAKNRCRQICGDGIVYQVQCDDGNLQDGDGCSSLCTLEENFGCNVDIPLAPSRCVYLKYDITLAVTKISRKFTENRGTFTFSLSPNLNIYNKLNFSSAFSFESNRSFLIQSLSVVKNELTIEVIFYQDLEDYFASLRLNLTFLHFLQRKASVDFFMISDDSKLIFIKDLKKIQLFGDILSAISILLVCAFIVSSLVNKMMGLETILPVQIVYLVHLINKQRYPCFGLLAYLGSTTNNYFFEGVYHPYVQQQCVATIFDKKKQATTLWVMFGLILASLIFTLISHLRKLMIYKKQQNIVNQQTFQNSIRNIGDYLYNHILFPFLIGTFSIFWPILMLRQNLKHQYLAVLTFLQAIILSSVFSFQFKELFLSQRQQTKLIYFKKAKKWYVPVFLLNLFIITLLISLAFIDVSIQMEPSLLVVQSLYLLFTLFFRPYQNILDNAVVIANNAMLVAYLAWNINRNYDPELRTQENEFFAIYAIIIAIGLMLIFSTIRIILEIVQLIQQRKRKTQKIHNNLQDFQSSVIAYKHGQQKLIKDQFQTSKQLNYMSKYGLNTRQFDKSSQIPLSFFEKSIKTENLKNNKMRFLKNYLLHKQEYPN